MFKLDFRKGRGTRDQIVNIHWIIEKAREFQEKHLEVHGSHTVEASLGEF